VGIDRLCATAINDLERPEIALVPERCMPSTTISFFSFLLMVHSSYTGYWGGVVKSVALSGKRSAYKEARNNATKTGSSGSIEVGLLVLVDNRTSQVE
jgi:hypothetical protein